MATFIGRLCKSYVRAVNIQEKRTGHLFEGKYKFKHIDDIPYLLHLSRYIHLNPVDAGLVKKSEQWKYSSYTHYCGLQQNEFIHSDIVLREFSGSEEYVAFVEDYSPPVINIQRYLFKE